MVPRLEDLLAEDGVRLRGSGKEREALCPFHEETTPSFSLNVEKQVYYCHSCGVKGNLYHYLTEQRGLQKREAMEIVNDGQVKPSRPIPDRKPYVWKWEKLTKAPHYLGCHHYRDADGKLAFVVIRSDRDKWLAQKPGDPKWAAKFAKCRAYHKADGGWVAKHPMDKDRPLYRLPELIEGMKRHPEKAIMLVEGEKCVDAVTRHMPNVLATTWPGGSKAWKKTDWKPLHGRSVNIIADTDEQGRQAAQQIAKHLGGECKVKIAAPKGDTGEDIADWLAKGGVKLALDHIRKHLQPFEAPKQEVSEAKQTAIEKNEYFEILGNIHDFVAIMLSTNRVQSLSRTALTSPSTLISIADFHWWTNLLGSETLPPSICQPVGSAMIRIADRRGQVDTSKMVGRGLFRTESGRYLWHLGDRLFTDGKTVPLGEYRSEMVALAGPRLSLGKTLATKEERQRVAEAVLAYRWRTPTYGKLFLGWIVSSLVGGALDWRPHLWMSGPHDTGKSWIMKHVARRIFGETCVALADATPAAVARRMQSDSLPMILDEAEPDRQNIDGVLDILRIAAGGDGERIRSDQGGNMSVQSFQPRFSAMLSSIKIANLSGGNRSRFVMPEFGPPVADWPKVQEEIENAIGESGLRFRSGIIHDGPRIVQYSRDLQKRMAKIPGLATRDSMIYAALSAGWRWWSGDAAPLMPERPERDVIQVHDDGAALLLDMLGVRLRAKDGTDHSISGLLADDPDDKLCVDYGLRVRSDGVLLVAARHPSLEAKMNRTRWRGVDLQKMLLQIRGVKRSDSQTRFGAMRTRPVEIGREALQRMGIAFESIEEESF